MRNALDDPIASKGLLRSAGNVLSGLAHAMLDKTGRFIGDVLQTLRKEAVTGTAKGIKYTALTIFAAKAGLLHTLARIAPETFGWLIPLLSALGL